MKRKYVRNTVCVLRNRLCKRNDDTLLLLLFCCLICIYMENDDGVYKRRRPTTVCYDSINKNQRNIVVKIKKKVKQRRQSFVRKKNPFSLK